MCLKINGFQTWLLSILCVLMCVAGKNFLNEPTEPCALHKIIYSCQNCSILEATCKAFILWKIVADHDSTFAWRGSVGLCPKWSFFLSWSRGRYVCMFVYLPNTYVVAVLKGHTNHLFKEPIQNIKVLQL
jgi:hypothetical protein